MVGEQTINVAPDNDQSGDTSQQSGAQSGVGLAPLIQEEQDKIQPLIINMVNRSQPVNDDTQAQASGGELHLTRGVIEALRVRCSGTYPAALRRTGALPSDGTGADGTAHAAGGDARTQYLR